MSKYYQVSIAQIGMSFYEYYKAVNCPHCGKGLFDVTTDSVGTVTIKCEMCEKTATIPIVADQK